MQHYFIHADVTDCRCGEGRRAERLPRYAMLTLTTGLADRPPPPPAPSSRDALDFTRADYADIFQLHADTTNIGRWPGANFIAIGDAIAAARFIIYFAQHASISFISGITRRRVPTLIFFTGYYDFCHSRRRATLPRIFVTLSFR